MGKKNKDKKGKGKEKTALKTEKKADKKAKKLLAEKGEDDIEKLIAEFQEKDRKLTEIREEKCGPPSSRCNMPICVHPTKDELVMFGGEHCTGNKTYVYNDFYFYNINKNEWRKLIAPNAPPPRCAHQAVTVKQGGGQMWMFGGEFASPTQSQFYHYKDLWVFHFKTRQWEMIKTPGPPSSRSGHRMVYCKKHLLVFGGFHDNIRDYKYFNDVYAFNLETYDWTRLEPSGLAPPPRSGCVMAALQDQAKVIVYGGYSKERVKRDVDRGTQHTDMYMLTAEGKISGDNFPEKWKWVHLKQTGVKPSPRCGMALALGPNNRAYCFGGVFDQDEDEEQIDSVFYNDMFVLDVDRGKWFPVTYKDKKTSEKKKRRRKKLENGEGEDDDEGEGDEGEEGDDEEEMEVTEDELQSMKLEDDSATSAASVSHGNDDNAATEDGVFKVSVAPQASVATATIAGDGEDMEVDMCIPSPRMGPSMVVKGNKLFLFGGTFEADDKQFTYSDFYCLDLSRMEQWQTILEQDKSQLEWNDSDSSDEEGATKGASGGTTKGDEDMDEEEDEDDDSEEDLSTILEGFDVPERLENESQTDYFERTQVFWCQPSQKYFEEEDMKVSKKTIMKFAKELCKEFCEKG